jgi:hypothetical protein
MMKRKIIPVTRALILSGISSHSAATAQSDSSKKYPKIELGPVYNLIHTEYGFYHRGGVALNRQKHRGVRFDFGDLVLCQTDFEVLSPGLSLPHRNHSRLKAGLKPHPFHRDEPLVTFHPDRSNHFFLFSSGLVVRF